MKKLTEKEILTVITQLEHKIQEPYLCPDTSINKEIQKVLNHIDFSEIDTYLKSSLKHSYKLLNTPHTKFGLLTLYSLCDSNDNNLRYRVLRILAFIYYHVLLNKYIRFCNPLILQKAIENVKSTNLFKSKGIAPALEHIAKQISSKSNNCELLYLVKRIYELRHRIAQSLKSITREYYKLAKEYNHNTVNYDRLIDKVIQHVLFYGNIKYLPECNKIGSVLQENLPYIDEDLLRASVEEIFRIMGTNPNKQKLLKNLNKLNYSKEVITSIGLPVNKQNLLCYLSSIYLLLKE